MTQSIKKFKINGLPKDTDFAALPFGRQIECRLIIENFKYAAKSAHISQKRQSAAKAIRDFLKLTGAKEYYCFYHDSKNYKDDTFCIWYK